LTSVEWNGGKTGKFYDNEYPIPAEMIKGKAKIMVRIDANQGRTAGRVFGSRVLRGK
jgi:hypothetical protein